MTVFARAGNHACPSTSKVTKAHRPVHQAGRDISAGRPGAGEGAVRVCFKGQGRHAGDGDRCRARGWRGGRGDFRQRGPGSLRSRGGTPKRGRSPGQPAVRRASRAAAGAVDLPGNGAGQVNGAGPVQVVFSAPLAPTSPLPTFSPSVAGSWHAGSGGTMVFTPTTPFEPGTAVTLRIPAGASGVRSATGGLLAKPATVAFQTGGWSTLRLEQLLAQLGYLPLSWAPLPQFGPCHARRRQPGPVELRGAARRRLRAARGRVHLAGRLPVRAHQPMAARGAQPDPHRGAHGLPGRSGTADGRRRHQQRVAGRVPGGGQERGQPARVQLRAGRTRRRRRR